VGKNQNSNFDQIYTVNSFDKLTDSFLCLFKDEFFWFSDSSKTYFSDNLSEVTGYDVDELKSTREIIFSDDIEDYKKALFKFENDESKNEIDLEYRITRKNGKVIWVDESLRVFRDDEGKITRSIGRVTDISERKSKENQINNDNKKLKMQNYSKDKFLNLLSHDLKSPFTSILGFTEILMKEASLEESERNEYLSYIYESSAKLLQLINYLLDWSRLQTGKLQVDSERINIQGLVYNSVSSLTGMAVSKNIDIKVDLDDSLHILGDERLLSIVVTNLLSNAIKFSNSDSSIVVKAASFNNDFIEFIVKDEGLGISNKDKVKMFKIDSMFSTEGTKGERGTGFGLIFTKEIVEKHGGELWFYTQEEKGSEFHFTVPSLPDTILIVGTESGLRDTFVKLLKEEYPDRKVVVAGNAYEAINNIGNILPSVIITPHEMPLMNGVQLMETLLKDKVNSELKIIVIVEDIIPALESAYKKFGDAVLIQKSKAIEQLPETLHRIIV
jgi:two-component system sensor histidine kinase/response regulator